MRSLVAWLGILVVRVGFVLGRVLPLRAGVVLATRDAEHPGGNLTAIRRELAARRAGGAGPRHRLPDAVRPRGRAATAWEALRLGYHLATVAPAGRRRLAVPALRRVAAPGHRARPGLARGGRLQGVRVQRRRPRTGRGRRDAPPAR